MLFRSNSRREVTKEPLQVVVRLRPLAGVSAETGYAWSIERRPDGQQWVCHQGKPESKGSFTFDHCFDDRTSNRELFDATAKTLVQAAVGGSNASILAYGQTSSGKTHSILGTPYEPGILSLSVEEIFGFQEDGLRAVGKQASVSYYEIFNEKVTDLLATNPVSTSLPVKESAGHGFFVQGLREAPVYSNEDVLCLVARGEERRRYARTRWNDYSSRSHVIFTLSFAARGAIEVSQARSKLNIVDLAGCENHKHEASEDGRHINRSLFFLGEVISKLCKDGHRLSWSPTRRSPSLLRKEVASPSPSPRELSRSGASWSAGLRTAENSRPRSPSRTRERSDFIPYRDSKLTRVLCSSLGGDARTLLLVTVHPAASFAEQSLTSLRFATKARSVDNYIPGAGSAGSAGSETSLATSDAQRTIEVLQDKLRRLEERQERGVAPGVADPYRRKDRRGPDADLLQKELEHMRVELREKERELANQARLLSERDRQLGQLREQLDMAKRHEGHRRHGPDAGGGLPPKADHWISGSFPEGLPFAGSEDFIESSQTWPLTSPMTRVSSASRAEDIPCLRSSSSFVMRQQQTPSEERGTAICETQEELVEKLVKMAAMQINTSKAQFAASSERETTDQPKEEAAANRKAEERKTLGPRRGCPPGPPAKAAGEGVPKNDLADSR